MQNQQGTITATDKAIAALLFDSIKGSPTTKDLLANEKQVSFAPPKTAQTEAAKISIYLYRVTPNQNLQYLITPCTGKTEADHQLLEEIIQTLQNNPVITVGNSELTVRFDSLSLEELTKLWRALETPLKPCVSCTISQKSTQPETLNQTQTAVASAVKSDNKNITELYQKVLQTFAQQSGHWKKRNMIQKSWILQDFNKVTGMSADEMLQALKNLGDKLEMNRPTEEFKEPLKQLAEFYKHQQEGLKGMEKFSQKQRENQAMIEQWIIDVKALLETLS